MLGARAKRARLTYGSCERRGRVVHVINPARMSDSCIYFLRWLSKFMQRDRILTRRDDARVIALSSPPPSANNIISHRSRRAYIEKGTNAEANEATATVYQPSDEDILMIKVFSRHVVR